MLSSIFASSKNKFLFFTKWIRTTPAMHRYQNPGAGTKRVKRPKFIEIPKGMTAVGL